MRREGARAPPRLRRYRAAYKGSESVHVPSGPRLPNAFDFTCANALAQLASSTPDGCTAPNPNISTCRLDKGLFLTRSSTAFRCTLGCTLYCERHNEVTPLKRTYRVRAKAQIQDAVHTRSQSACPRPPA
eukprot:1196152-Prorocentrum_minimum.AAC.4